MTCVVVPDICPYRGTDCGCSIYMSSSWCAAYDGCLGGGGCRSVESANDVLLYSLRCASEQRELSQVRTWAVCKYSLAVDSEMFVQMAGALV